MDDSVKRYRERRDARVRAKKARVDDQWITMRGTHVLIDDGGQVAKGPDNLKNVVKQGGGYKSKAERKYGSTDKFNKFTNNGWNTSNRNVPSGGGKKAEPARIKPTSKNLKSEIENFLNNRKSDTPGIPKKEYEALRSKTGADEETFKKVWNSVNRDRRIKNEIRNFMDSDERKNEVGVPMEKYEELRNMLGAKPEEFKKAWNLVQHERREKLDPEEEKTWHPEYYTKSGDDSPVVRGGDPNQHYIYGSGKSQNGATGGTTRQNEEYESIPFSVRFAGRKHADPADVKKARETVSRFIKNAQVGDVYQVGGGFGSTGGQKFKVVTSRGKPALAWQDEDGYYKRPVQMSRANVEDFISNGAKLVKNEK